MISHLASTNPIPRPSELKNHNTAAGNSQAASTKLIAGTSAQINPTSSHIPRLHTPKHDQTMPKLPGKACIPRPSANNTIDIASDRVFATNYSS